MPPIPPALRKRIRAEDAFSTILDEDEHTQQDAVCDKSDTTLEFEAFVERMKNSRRTFYLSEPIKGKPGENNVVLLRSNFFENDDDAVQYHIDNFVSDDVPLEASKKQQLRMENQTSRTKWMNCVRLEFGKRRRKFFSRFPSMASFVLRRFLPVMAVLLLFLAVQWPLWDFLIDVESLTVNHYKVLGISPSATPADIKKAYRAMVKEWHPDLKPDCGEKCRKMMMKIQEAHDVLLAKGDKSNELADKHKALLQQIRGLFFFRAYQMAFHASEFLNMLVLPKSGLSQYFPRVLKHKSLFRSCSAIAMILLFTYFEVCVNTGFNVIIILQVFYFCANAVRADAQRATSEKISKRCNFDILKDLTYILIPSVLCHLVYYFFFDSSSESDQFSYNLVFGIVFLASHLARFSPNLFDNFSSKKCSISLQYVNRADLKFSKWEFFTTELGVIVDDLFAFTSYVPFPYRLMAILVHVVYLVQMRYLPWDAPAVGKLQSRYHKEHDDDDGDVDTGTGILGRNVLSKKGSSQMTDRELQLFQKVDDEEVSWISAGGYKYQHILVKHVTQMQASGKQGKIDACLKVSRHLQFVYVIVSHQVHQDQPPHAEIKEKIFDPDVAAIIAREAGPSSILLSENLKTLTDPGVTATRYKEALGDDWALMMSQTFHAKTHGTQVNTGLILRVVVAIACAFVFLCVVTREQPFPDGTERETFDPFLPPLISRRFGHILPDEHILNQAAGNMKASQTVPIVTPDLYDTLRQLSFYAEDDAPVEGAVVAPKKLPRKQQQQQQAPKGKQRSASTKARSR